jgi:hypothetical protein
MKIENFIQVEKWVAKQDHHASAGLKERSMELLGFWK